MCALSRDLSPEPARQVDRWLRSTSAGGPTSISKIARLRQVWIPPRPPFPILESAWLLRSSAQESRSFPLLPCHPTFHASTNPIGSALKINPGCGWPATQSHPASCHTISLLDISPPPSLPCCLSPRGPQESPFPQVSLLHPPSHHSYPFSDITSSEKPPQIALSKIATTVPTLLPSAYPSAALRAHLIYESCTC